MFENTIMGIKRSYPELMMPAVWRMAHDGD